MAYRQDSDEEVNNMPEAPAGSVRRRDIQQANQEKDSNEKLGIDGKVYAFIEAPSGDESEDEGGQKRKADGKSKEEGKSKKGKKDKDKKKDKKKNKKDKKKDKKKKKKKRKKRSSSSSASRSKSSSVELEVPEKGEASGSAPAAPNPEIEKAKSEAIARLQELKSIEPKEERMKRFRALLREWHPDKNLERSGVAKEVFQFLQKGKALME